MPVSSLTVSIRTAGHWISPGTGAVSERWPKETKPRLISPPSLGHRPLVIQNPGTTITQPSPVVLGMVSRCLTTAWSRDTQGNLSKEKEEAEHERVEPGSPSQVCTSSGSPGSQQEAQTGSGQGVCCCFGGLWTVPVQIITSHQLSARAKGLQL